MTLQIRHKSTAGAIEITTAKVCSVNCTPHCPQLAFRGAYGDAEFQLPYDDYVRALSTVPANVIVTFAGYSEPFMNRRALDMMEYAKAKGHRVKVFSTLVGLLPNEVPRFAALAPDVFVLHEPDNHGIAHIPDTPTYRETHARVMRSMEIHGRSRMDGAFVSNQRAGNCADAPPHHVSGPFFCSKLVDPEPVLLPNCDLTLCCNDWRLKHILGNLLRSSWTEIVQGDAFRAIVRESWAMDGSSLCRSCTFAAPTMSTARVRIAARHFAEKIGAVEFPLGTA